MLKQIINNQNNKSIPIDINSEHGSSDRDFVFGNLLNIGSNVAINKIFDSELVEFTPNYKNVN